MTGVLPLTARAGAVGGGIERQAAGELAHGVEPVTVKVIDDAPVYFVADQRIIE